MSLHFLKIYYTLGICLIASGCAYEKIRKSKDIHLKLRKADEYFDKKKYEKAQTLYYELVPFFKSSDKFEYIAYRYAYCSYLMKDYTSSQELFKDYMSTFPTSDKNEEAAYLKAKSSFQSIEDASYTLDPTEVHKTIASFQTFLQNYPGSPYQREIEDILAKCRARLEIKTLKAAEQYYNMERYKAAAIYFNQLSQEFLESPRADEYKYRSIESAYQYAEKSVTEKKTERFEWVIKEYQEFVNRFSDSKFAAKANVLYASSSRFIKNIRKNL